MTTVRWSGLDWLVEEGQTVVGRYLSESKARQVAQLDRNDCRCGHDEYEHDEDGVCMIDRCDCARFTDTGAVEDRD